MVDIIKKKSWNHSSHHPQKSAVHVIAQPHPSLSPNATSRSKFVGARKYSNRCRIADFQSLGMQALIRKNSRNTTIRHKILVTIVYQRYVQNRVVRC